MKCSKFQYRQPRNFTSKYWYRGFTPVAVPISPINQFSVRWSNDDQGWLRKWIGWTFLGSSRVDQDFVNSTLDYFINIDNWIDKWTSSSIWVSCISGFIWRIEICCFSHLGYLKNKTEAFLRKTCYNFGMGDWVSHFQTSVEMGQNGPKSLDGFHTQNAPNPGSLAISNG